MAITLSPSALARVKGFLSGNPEALGMRLGVQRTGCSGWGYQVDLATQERPGDSISEQDGVRIYVDPDSLPLVDGTRIDFVREGLNEVFSFSNPNVAAECGCGESFTTDPDRAT